MKELRERLQDYAAEDAVKDIKFAGETPWYGIAPEKRKEIERAMVEYARRAAARTYDTLNLKGMIKKEGVQ